MSLLTFERSRSKFKVVCFVYDLPATAMALAMALLIQLATSNALQSRFEVA